MGKPTVLIVDDETKFTKQFSSFLEDNFNVDVLVAADSNKGLEYLKSKKIDVLFQDIQVPGPDGFEVVKFIKREGKDQGMSIYLVSGWREDIYYKRCEELGAKYIVKPPSFKSLKTELEGVFKNKGGLDYAKK